MLCLFHLYSSKMFVGMLSELQNNGVTVAEWINLPEEIQGGMDIDKHLKKLRESGRSKCS